TKVVRSFANRTLKYTFEDTKSYKIASVSAYELLPGGVSRMTIASGNSMDVYNAGKYVVTVTTENGMVEMFALDVTKEDLSNKSASSKVIGGEEEGGDASLGIGLGVGIGGIVIAAAAITATIIVTKKKKA
ncbi:MAG: hypothetical protein K2L02_00430, partial [Clostridia bacterium]|nr:hypothetical protein [Clostridia bacterium]